MSELAAIAIRSNRLAASAARFGFIWLDIYGTDRAVNDTSVELR